jgi:hypothetical protein
MDGWMEEEEQEKEDEQGKGEGTSDFVCYGSCRPKECGDGRSGRLAGVRQ